jgi:molybdopterin-guanine dinucleotide biosynthesis protein A
MTVVVVLAGGSGTRMGGAKPSASLQDRPLVSYPVAAGIDAGLDTIVVAKPSTVLPEIDSRVTILLEADEPRHPLLGLITALERFPRVIAVGCDMPFLEPALLGWLAARADAPLAFTVAGVLAPFPSLHIASELPSLRSSLATEASLRRAFASAGTVPLDSLDRFGEPQRLLTSINSPAELADAARMIERQPNDRRA